MQEENLSYTSIIQPIMCQSADLGREKWNSTRKEENTVNCDLDGERTKLREMFLE